MGWERRGNRDYYYRAARIDGRVVKEYVPPLLADVTADRDDDRRAEQAAEDDAIRTAKASAAALDKQLDELDMLADRLAEAALLAAGYHQHNRGEWRARRGK